MCADLSEQKCYYIPDSACAVYLSVHKNFCFVLIGGAAQSDMCETSIKREGILFEFNLFALAVMRADSGFGFHGRNNFPQNVMPRYC